VAVSWSFLDVLARYGTIRRGGTLLDIGSSNIYDVPSEGLIEFLRRFGCVITPDAVEFAREVEAGSGRQADGSALNGAWLGQVLHAIGMHYDSVDIAVGYLTRVVDLNRSTLPADMFDSFDMVLNCGTTEHILNQFNAFKSIHDAARIGGLMVHQVPASGYTNHGYFCYTLRFFFDLAGYNDYELVDFWVDGPAGHDKMYTAVRDYVSDFPAARTLIDRIGSASRETIINEMNIPNNGATVIFRKTLKRRFNCMLELSTSWGHLGGIRAEGRPKTRRRFI
jgi:SAM-dependent methyltransferase